MKKSSKMIRCLGFAILLTVLFVIESRALSISTSGSRCTPSTPTFTVSGSCGGSYFWTFAVSTGSVTIPGTLNGSTINPTFTRTGTGVGQATVTVTAHCASSGETVSIPWDVMPRVDASVDLSFISPVCSLQGIALSATGTNNSSSYTFTIDGHSFTTSSSAFGVPNEYATPGSHDVSVSTPASGSCPGAAGFDSGVVSVTAPTTFTANLSIEADPVLICTAGGHVNGKSIMVTTAGAPGFNNTFTYDWNYNDNHVGTANENPRSFDLSVGDRIYCTVTINNNVSRCIAPAKTATTTIQQHIDQTPGLGINVPTDLYCSGDLITLTSTQSGSHYRWYLDNVQFDSDASQTSIGVSDVFTAGYFSPGRSLRLEVDGVSAPPGNQCTFSYNLSTSVSPGINIRPLPTNLGIGWDRDPFCSNGVSSVTTNFSSHGDNVSEISWTFSSSGHTMAEIGALGPLTSGVDPITQQFTSHQEVNWNPTFSGIVSVTITGFGCRGVPYSKTYELYPQPHVEIAGTVDVPFDVEFTTLSATVDPKYQYQWTLNGKELNVSSNTLAAAESGLYSVSVVESDHNCSDYAYATVRYENSRNVVIENTLLNDKKTDGSMINLTDVDNLTPDQRTKKLDYYDGLGRPMQTVVEQNSPSVKDFVQPVIYDGMGKEPFKYLPYASTEVNGWYKEEPVGENSPQANFYEVTDMVAHDDAPYSKTGFEYSPINRVLEQGAPGTAWQIGTGHTIVKDYLTNGATDVLLFNFNISTGEVSLLTGSNAYYQANVLLCNKTTDEQGNDVLEYVDKLGRTVCKKVKAPGNAYACTYYIYDDLGNLVVVLPPEGVQRIINGN